MRKYNDAPIDCEMNVLCRCVVSVQSRMVDKRKAPHQTILLDFFSPRYDAKRARVDVTVLGIASSAVDEDGGTTSVRPTATVYADVDLQQKVFIHSTGVVHLSDETVDILNSFLPSAMRGTKFRVWINPAGYPYFLNSLCTIHLEVSKSKRDADIAYWRSQGYGVKTTWYVAHLDDNKNNFNVTNLMVVPEEVNRWSRKPRGAKPARSGFSLRVTFDGVVTGTKRVDSIAEARHAYDTAKMHRCPERAKQFIFNYGLLRPDEFLIYYTTPEALAARYETLYTPKVQKKSITRTLRTRTIGEDDWDQHIRDAIEKAADHPFDPARDVVVEYSGRTLTIQFLLELEDFDSLLMEKADVDIGKHPGGYILLNKMGIHRIILGLQKGQYDKKGCHGKGGPLDNRKRTLRVDSNAGNMRDISKKTSTTSSTEPNVSWNQQQKLWSVRIRIHGNSYHCRCTKCHDEAVRISRAVRAIVNHLESLDSDGIRATIRGVVNSCRL